MINRAPPKAVWLGNKAVLNIEDKHFINAG